MAEHKRKRCSDEESEIEGKKPRLDIDDRSGNRATPISDDADSVPESSSGSGGPENDRQQTAPNSADSTGVETIETNVFSGESKPYREIPVECLNTDSKISTLDEVAVRIQCTTRALPDDLDGECASIEISESTCIRSMNGGSLVLEEISEEKVYLQYSNTEQADAKNHVKNDVNDDIEDDVKDEVKNDVKDDVKNDVKNDVEDYVDDHVKDDIKNDVENDAKDEQRNVEGDIKSLQDVEESIDREDDQAKQEVSVEDTENESMGTVELQPTETNRTEDNVQGDTTSQRGSEEAEENKFLYRLLRPGEEFTTGIFPKNPHSNLDVETHVAYGSSDDITSRYVSCSKSLSSIESFACRIKKAWRSQLRYIVQIDRTLLGDDVEEIDLTKDEVRQEHLTSLRSRRNALRFDEVLLVPKTCVPSSSITKIAHVQHDSTVTMHQD